MDLNLDQIVDNVVLTKVCSIKADADSTESKQVTLKIKFDNIADDAIGILKEPTYNNIMKVAVDYSDALIIGSEEIPNELQDYLNNCEKPVLDYHNPETFAEAYTEFYNTQVLS